MAFVGLPTMNIVAFVAFAASGLLFSQSRLRLRASGESLRIASLAGSLEVDLAGVDVTKPMGLIAVVDGDPMDFSSAAWSPTLAWSRLRGQKERPMQARQRPDGVWEPLSNTRSTRSGSSPGVEVERYVFCRARPSRSKSRVAGR